MNIANSLLLQELQYCNNQGFTGKLCVNSFIGNSFTDISGECWYFIFYQGRLIGNIGGIHPLRRLRRQFQLQNIELDSQMALEMARESKTPNLIYWLLEELPRQRKIDRVKLLRILEGSILETLFDVLRCEVLWEMKQRKLSFSLEPYSFADDFTPIVPIGVKSMWVKVCADLKNWQKKGLLDWCPHWSPQIINYDKLRDIVPEGTYVSVVEMLNSDQSIRDIAITMSEEISVVGAILLNYCQQQLVEIRPINDLEIVDPEIVDKAIEQFLFVESGNLAKKPMVVHVCKVPSNIRVVHEEVTKASCSYVQVDGFTQSLTTCLRDRPAMVLVDGKSVVNSYELCDRLYGTGKFKNIPIVLLGGPDNLLARMRGVVNNAVEYHPGSIDRQRIAQVLQKHL